MSWKHFIGIDISKDNLDVCLLDDESKVVFYQCKNTKQGIETILEQIIKSNHLEIKQVLFCAEHTGHYGSVLCQVLEKKGYSFWLENPSQIKLSQGVQRGKDDQLDAERIAVYARRFKDKAFLFKATEPIYEQLSYLCSERDLLVADRAKYKAQLKDERVFIRKELYEMKVNRYQKLINELDVAIGQIEAQIEDIIKKDKNTKAQYDKLVSIDGVGKQVAIQTLIATRGFTRFTEARKFTCHAGCAPFRYNSGSSIRSKHKVSQRADKVLKRLFHMAALSAIRMKGELRDYFMRKVAEGKNKMSVINAVRSKLIGRIFAVIQQNRKYEKIYINPLV